MVNLRNICELVMLLLIIYSVNASLYYSFNFYGSPDGRQFIGEVVAQNDQQNPSGSNLVLDVEWLKLIFQVAAGGALAGLAIFSANLWLDRHRRPEIIIEQNNSIIRSIDLTVFNLEHHYYPLELRRFAIRYNVHRVPIRNTSQYAAENCKASITQGGLEEKICWIISQERYSMTINARSAEFVDVCAYVVDEQGLFVNLNEVQRVVFDRLNAVIARIEERANSTNRTEDRNPGRELVRRLRRDYPSHEQIPMIISPTENGWAESLILNRALLPNEAEIVITSKNGRSEARQYITILPNPDGERRILRFNL